MNKIDLRFSLVNSLNWRNATHQTEHGVLPTPDFLNKLVELIMDEYDLTLADD